MWTNAITIDICKECGSDIFPGDRVLRDFYREAAEVLTGEVKHQLLVYCEDCGKLYEESNER